MPVRRIMRLAPFRVRMRFLDSVERRVVRFIPEQRKLQVVRRATPISVRPRRKETVYLRTHLGRARCEEIASPVGVRKSNLDRVASALAAVGVVYRRIPAQAAGRTAVAVPATDRAAVLAVLAGWERLGGIRIDVKRRHRAGAPVISVSWPVTDPRGTLVLGGEYGCDIEFWTDGKAPRPNPVADEIDVRNGTVSVPETVFSAFADARDVAAYPTDPVFAMTAPERVRFPVDVVYTWVDGGDPAWQARKAAALAANGWITDANAQTANDSRFVSREELRHSLRSLHAYAPWVRRVFLVTDDQVPGWLDTSQVTVVSHREIFGDAGTLPTFNSQAIESRLHHIPGLAEHFLYLNDDVFFGRPVTPELFFTPGGLTKFFPSKALMGSGEKSIDDLPVNAAGKNVRTLIERTFGCRITQKMMHTPHPSRRSVLAELERTFPVEIGATGTHQFRHPDDVAVPSSLQHYWAWLTGRGVPAPIAYSYVDLAEPVTPIKLARILRLRHLDAFCLNDTESDAAVVHEQAELLRDFLPAYFPFPSPYELPGASRPTCALTPVDIPEQPSAPVPVTVKRRPTNERRERGRKAPTQQTTSRS
jgi:hypothetical protein